MQIRTDLATEAHDIVKRENKGKIDGITSATKILGNIKLTRIDILTATAAKRIGKNCGAYVTIEAPNIHYSLDDYETVTKLISKELTAMTDINERKSVLVVGLGNRAITPDALGCCCVDNILVTREMESFFENEINSVSAIAPGVLGTTGIETIDIIKGITEKISPSLVIAIDALAAADVSRIANTVQIADTGIQPGAGVGNNRKGLNKETLGVKVIAIGVPTVIDAQTISKIPLPEDISPLTVTTKDIDIVIAKMSGAVADGINKSLHPNLTQREISELIG